MSDMAIVLAGTTDHGGVLASSATDHWWRDDVSESSIDVAMVATRINRRVVQGIPYTDNLASGWRRGGIQMFGTGRVQEPFPGRQPHCLEVICIRIVTVNGHLRQAFHIYRILLNMRGVSTTRGAPRRLVGRVVLQPRRNSRACISSVASSGPSAASKVQ